MKSIRTLMTLCLFLAATQVFAQHQSWPMLRAKVPFAFTVGNEMFPAGEYRISSIQLDHSIRIAGEGANRPSSIQTVSRNYAIRPSQKTRLVFARYGDSYFLKEIWKAGSDETHLFPESTREKELAKAGFTRQLAEVVQGSSGR